MIQLLRVWSTVMGCHSFKRTLLILTTL